MGKDIEIKCNQKLFFEGAVLAMLGVAGPAMIMESNVGIYDSLTAAMMWDTGSNLISAAMKLVLMNAVRMLPHYLGVFLMNESVGVYRKSKKLFLLNVVFSLSLIVLIYDLILRIYGIGYDLGIPALLTIAFVLLLSYLDLFSVSMLNKILLVGSLLISIQWLDVIPFLTEHGFGRGEISMDLKKASQFIGEEYLLTVFAGSMFAAFFFAAMMQVQLLYKEHKLKISMEKTSQVEKELYQTQIEALKMRNASEVQNLVHDLKSPLTTIQGLISLAEMMEQDELLREYFQKISSSLTTMSSMISEILYEKTRTPMKTSDLMGMVLAQVSIQVPNNMLEYENRCPDAVFRGNKIRLSRALINLINNAYAAVDKETGLIKISLDKKEGLIEITVWDNGVGIDAENMEHVWEIGYSGRSSTGLGLAFTKQVVERNGGTIRLESQKNRYTKAVICLEEEKDEREDNSGH